MKSIVEDRLIAAREKFKAGHGAYPIVMRLGTEIYKQVSNGPAWAIESTLVVEEKQLPGMAVAMIKPPKEPNAAA